MLDFFKDILSAFRQNSLERIKSPFLGAFVFSWLGFNWQMLAVLILSKQNIIGRLEYINKIYSVKDYILAPIFTTALICILLPLINKSVTKLQKKTNHETNQLILQSKIDIAEEQLKIADIEAQKRLAEEREKKNIESNIDSILKECASLRLECENLKQDNHEFFVVHQKMKSEEKSLQSINNTLESNLAQARVELGKSLDSLSKANADVELLRKENVEVEFLKNDRERLNNEYLKLVSEKVAVEGSLSYLTEKINAYDANYEWYTKRINAFKEQYREILNSGAKLKALISSGLKDDPAILEDAEKYLKEIMDIAEIREPRGGAIPPYDFRSNNT
ncbi:hypothetical protein [Pantoea agglomerans]|uniref:hypothetical protein n=1 Tax=Enterobacter agglomerans TaxID=549 RepID=UPI0016544BD3|nr:hypothetical protein [Pantoea agglomerans]